MNPTGSTVIGCHTMSFSDFLATRLVAGAFAVAFASNLSQAEIFTGSCGLHPSVLHGICVLLCLVGLFTASAILLKYRVGISDSTLVCGLSLMYLLCSLMQFQELLSADLMLIEAGLLLSIPGIERGSISFFLARALLGVSLGKLINCGAEWTPWASMKSDALNQPFPFTPVWHLAQLPQSLAAYISCFIFTLELLLGCSLAVMDSTGPLISFIGLSIFYGLLGNFGWVPLVLVACAVKLLPQELVVLLIGNTTLRRWGYQNSTTLAKDSVSDSKLLRGLVECVVCVISAFCLSIFLPSVWKYKIDQLVRFAVIGLTALALISMFKSSQSKLLNLMMMCGGIVISQNHLTTALTAGRISTREDFSSLPTCYTFQKGSLGEAVHSSSSRAVFLLQTKYSVIGTNTVGSDLGGTRYAELSVPGSVHGDEVRPPFLLGHIPRLALTVWGVGTGLPANVAEGLKVLRRLELMVESGSQALRVFFTTAEESLLNALVAPEIKNQVQSFYQAYEVTSRAADHQWFKRNYQAVSAIPTSSIPSTVPAATRCSTIVPTKIMGATLDLILPSLILGALAVRLLFSSEKRRSSSSRK